MILELLLFFCWCHFLVSEEGEKDVVTNLNGVDVEKTLRRGDKGKVDCVGPEQQNKYQ
jgi:hypothetical protein